MGGYTRFPYINRRELWMQMAFYSIVEMMTAKNFDRMTMLGAVLLLALYVAVPWLFPALIALALIACFFFGPRKAK